ncbi:MAG: AAA family ATPase [Candidatus Altiarchaeota archaeon]|nr:AAA family ATPase [Candidatus Altiarchaeota archaeon]MBU4437896.1 AAA family ATPase [Candidatus Altiarchaeota archaeon]
MKMDAEEEIEFEGDDRCPTGIPGLDEVISGGFPRGRTILLTGACGTGKTIFGIQYLFNGITKYNEPGVLVLLEQNIEQLKKDMRSFNYDIRELEEVGKLVVIDASLSRFNVSDINLPKPSHDRSFSLTSVELIETKEVVDIIIDTAKEIGARRIVIDSLPALNNLVKSRDSVRDIILNMNYRLQGNGFTSVLIDDIFDDSKPGFSIQAYVVDGVVVLDYKTSGPDIGRYLTIQKMRGTKHSDNIHPIRFTEGVGMEVLGLE